MKVMKALSFLALLSFGQAAVAQKLKIDSKAIEIIGENAAAAVAIEKFRSEKIDSVKTRKQKVNEALLQINVFKASLKKAKQDTEFFRLETGYYRHIIEDAAAIVLLIPKFVATATSVSPQASVKAIKVGTEISEEVAGIVSTYKKVCTNEVEEYVDSTGNSINPGNEGNSPTVPSQGDDGSGNSGNVIPGGNSGGSGSDDNSGGNSGGNTNPSIGQDDNPVIPPIGGGGSINPIDDGTGSGGGGNKPVIGGDDGGLIRNARAKNAPRKIDFGDKVNYKIRNSDGFNWLDRSERLELAINLSTRLACIRYDLEMFIRTAKLYKPIDIIRMIDQQTWAIATASDYIVDDIIYSIDNFNPNLNTP